MTAVAARVTFDPLRDKSYQGTALGPAIVDFLAWFELGGKAKISVDNYERRLSRGALLYPDVPLEELTGSHLLQIAAAFPVSYRREAMASWSSFFRWARQTRKVAFNPCEELPAFKRRGKKVFDVFSEPEVGLLCDLPLRDGALMQLMFDAGLRKGECRRLRLANLRATAARVELVILSGKGDKDRSLPATAAVARKVSELALLDGLERTDHLWYGMLKTPQYERVLRDRPVAEGTFARWWSRCLADAGVRYRNPHMTRHTFATRYLRMGGTLERLSMAMGHASIRTTFDLYAHLDTSDLIDEFERVFAVAPLNQSDRGE